MIMEVMLMKVSWSEFVACLVTPSTWVIGCGLWVAYLHGMKLEIGLVVVEQDNLNEPYFLWYSKVDLQYMQNLRAIADIHENGVTKETFHEVSFA